MTGPMLPQGSQGTRRRLTPEEYAEARANGWDDNDLRAQGVEPPEAPEAPATPAAGPPRRLTREEYAEAQSNGWDDDDLRAQGVEPPEPYSGNRVADIARSAIGQGAGFGFGDEIMGAVRGAMSPFVSVRQGIDDERAKVRQYQQAHPGESLAAEIGGGVLTGGVVGKSAVKTAGRAATSKTARELIRQMAQGAKTGGYAGAITGAGHGEGVVDRLKQAAGGAALGGPLGALIPGAVAGGRQLGRWLGARPGLVAKEETGKALRTAAERGGRTTDDVAAEINDPTRELAVMDVDPQLRRLSVDVAKMPGSRAERTIQDAVDARATRPVQGALEDIEGAFGARAVDPKAQRDHLLKQIRARDTQRFGDVWKAAPGPINDPQVLRQWDAITGTLPKHLTSIIDEQRIAQRPMGEVLGQIQTAAGEVRPAPTLRGIHRLKVALDKAVKVGEDAEKAKVITSDQAMNLSALRAARDQLKTLAFDRLPGGREYQQALAASRADRQVVGAGEYGKQVFKKTEQTSTPQVQRRVAEVAAQPKAAHGNRAMRATAADALRQMAGNSPEEASTFLSRLGTRGVGDKVATLAGPTKAKALAAKLADRQRMQATNQVQSKPSVGPQSILEIEHPGTAAQFGEAVALSGGSPRLLAGSMLMKARKGFRGQGMQRGADDLADIITTPLGPQAAQKYTRAVELLTQLHQQRLRQAGKLAGANAGGMGAALFSDPYADDAFEDES